MRTTTLLLFVIAATGIIFAGCTSQQDIGQEDTQGEVIDTSNQSPAIDTNDNESFEEDPINETFEDDTVEENDDVEIGELI